MSPPQPRILMTSDAVGGVWTFSTTLARALCATGYEVTLVTLGPTPSAQQLAALKEVPRLFVQVTDLALEWMDPQGDDFARAEAELARIVQRARPDLIHLNGYREVLCGFDVPVVVVAHSCVGSWWDACRSSQRMESKWASYLDRVGAALDAADAWVAPTYAYRDWIERFYGPTNLGEVIWNGVPPIKPGARKQPFVLAAGRGWDEAKNLAALARISPALACPVRIAGPMQGEDGGQIQLEHIEQLGRLSHAHLLEQMAQAAIFVSPALYEPFGLVVLEAGASGCALVLSDIPTFRELWCGAALFVDPHDDDGLTHAIRRLCEDDQLRAEMQRKAEKRARRYSLEATVNDYCCLYDRLTLSLQPRQAVACIHAEAHG